MPQRQLASCIPAMVEYYRQSLELNGDPDEMIDLEQLEETESAHPQARQRLLELISRWDLQRGPDSKFAALLQCIQNIETTQPNEPIVIFSYFKRTLEYLHRQLTRRGWTATVISGDYPVDERERRIQGFRDGKYRILLSSEVGSEGLDFQFCHIMFNYDLPWNPMKVEQRIGRLDRYGQQAPKVQIYTLNAASTIEDEILRRLYHRINIFQSYIGDLEEILGDVVTELTTELFQPGLTREQMAALIEQKAILLERRRLDREEWERAAPEIIGQDRFYLEELDRSIQLGRFVGPRDLEVFFRDFLTIWDSRSKLRPTKRAGVFELRAGERFRDFVRALPESEERSGLLTRLARPSLLTFDAEIAESEPEVEYVHARHPLIRSIVDYYRNHPERVYPASRVRVSGDGELPRGRYAYVVARVRIYAARYPRGANERLVPVVVNLEDLRCLDSDSAERLMARMVQSGETAGPEGIDAERLKAALHRAREELVVMSNQYKAQEEEVNERFLHLRRASVEHGFNVRLERQKTRLDQARQRSSDPRYVRMLEGGIRRLEREREEKLEEIEKTRAVSAEWEMIAAGCLVVD